ncbi:MAG TPA: 4-(cytidine 5'-diphospho)-2-C-methyl-D-erythritol kinase [Defluviitaleaceae bacterium]|jgi:4-diphosphocytidyl-2-C-methyl-D-erythritol kinase|nr:4-(cytidine 5'-diphospho)-2-C-methyl-D-erythritol kinase [Candidatus Epulonipiscium sp.]HOA79740.1 4-(cytidine 5'-diphospho)-2-C-methyl-D-erythritol kinase [Defluviitaleaceae bacterium]
MHEIELKARAKINLALDVIGKRNDGYHNVRMVMQTVNLYDYITIRKTRSPGIILKTDLKWLPEDERNIAYRAAKLMVERYNIKEGILIDLKKRIPVAAGLAGGSSDAAAVFVGLNKLFGLKIPKKELMNLGYKLGADIPYCILRGTALAEGIGEKLTKLPPMPFCYVVIAKPNFSVSTAHVYQNLSLDNLSYHPDIEAVIKGIKTGDLDIIAKNLGNVLESVTAKEYPIINDIKKTMIEYGALGALMSGSGPSVFGLYRNKKEAQAASTELKLHSEAKDVFIATIFNRER